MKTESEEHTAQTRSENYTPEKVTCRDGKIVKWTGKEVASGEWPEDCDFSNSRSEFMQKQDQNEGAALKANADSTKGTKPKDARSYRDGRGKVRIDRHGRVHFQS
jgi:hypothetical protein